MKCLFAPQKALAWASVMMMIRCSVVVLFASLQRWQPSSCAAAAALGASENASPSQPPQQGKTWLCSKCCRFRCTARPSQPLQRLHVRTCIYACLQVGAPDSLDIPLHLQQQVVSQHFFHLFCYLFFSSRAAACARAAARQELPLACLPAMLFWAVPPHLCAFQAHNLGASAPDA